MGEALTPQDAREPGWALADGVGGDRGGRRGSREAGGLPRLPGGWWGQCCPGTGRGKVGKLGRLPGPAGGRVSGRLLELNGNLTPWRQQLVGFWRPGLPVAERAEFRAAKASRRRDVGRGP